MTKNEDKTFKELFLKCLQMNTLKNLYAVTFGSIFVIAEKYFTSENRLTAFELTLIIINAYLVGTLNG